MRTIPVFVIILLLAIGLGALVTEPNIASGVAAASAPTPIPVPAGGVVNERFVFVLTNPDSHSPVRGRLTKNQTFSIQGQQGDCKWLLITDGKGLTGWVLTDNRAVTWDVNCAAVPLGEYRPNSSVLGRRLESKGRGKLQTVNEGADDAVVVLVTPDQKHKVSVYVRSGETFSLGKLPDGEYELFTMTGAAWNRNTFTRDVVREKMVEPFVYDSPRNKYVVWTFTLEPATGGNAESIAVSVDDFPTIEID